MKEKTTQVSLLKRFLPYYGKYKIELFFDLCCAALTTLCELVLPLIARTITATATRGIAGLTVSMILRMGGLYLLLTTVLTFAVQRAEGRLRANE